jgi:succinoglycan biosynthesis transport protein ExoP
MAPILEEIEKRYKDVNYDSLLGSNQLTISQLEETKILEVRYRDTDPKKFSLSYTRLLEVISGTRSKSDKLT